jgi:hypothetical protein
VLEPRPEQLPEPKRFRLRAGVSWKSKGPSGRAYVFRGRETLVVHFATDADAFKRLEALEEVT